MTLISSISLALTVMVFAITPGPGIFLTISKSLSSGFKIASIVVFGLCLGDIFYLLFAIYGLSFVVEHMGSFFQVMKIIGGSYLIYLAFKIWNSSTKVNFKSQKEESLSKNFLTGLLVTSSNPKVIFFYLGFIPAFMDLTILTTSDVIIVSIIVFASLMVSVLAVALAAHKAKEMFKNQNAVRILNRISATLMFSVGILLYFN
ncbi:MAG: LysE family translocator [Sulfurovum sp.]|nr:MAG: Homoserine/homoserine lactone efflux protein [Arcobacter lacus]